MRVLLISANTTRTPHAVYPLGLDYLAGSLAPRHAVQVLDMNTLADGEALAAALRAAEPQVVGLSIRNIDNTDALSPRGYLTGYGGIVRTVRAVTKAPIVLGGCGYSIFPAGLLTRLEADYGVVGEGEALGALLDALETGTPEPASLPGIVTRTGRGPVPVPWTGTPRRRLPPTGNPLRFYLDRGGILNLQTKRGCPFRCFYCTYPHLEGRRLRLFPPAEVGREARALQELGARFLFVTDSAFNADEAHSLAVAEAFRREGVTIPWGAFLAPLRPRKGYYEALAAAGLTHVEFGTESLCDPQLERYGKPFAAAEVQEAHAAARQAGLHVAHYLLLGGPGEDDATLTETLARTETLAGAAFFVFCGVRIFPHTPLYRLALREGVVAPGEDLLEPRFYRSPAIGAEEILARVKGHAAGRRHWVYGDGADETERILTRLHARGHAGPLWELLLR